MVQKYARIQHIRHTYQAAKNPQVVLYRVIEIATFTTRVSKERVVFENGVNTHPVASKFRKNYLYLFSS